MNLFDIDTYKKDGFVKVADVLKHYDGTWALENQHEYLWSDHRSWVYAIVVGQEVVKIGETGLPLGIRKKRERYYKWPQPVIGTHNRFGRLRGFGEVRNPEWKDTDVRIRRALLEEQEPISLWVRKCEVATLPITVYGQQEQTQHAYHKELEKAYLTRIEQETGCLPRLNIGKI